MSRLVSTCPKDVNLFWILDGYAKKNVDKFGISRKHIKVIDDIRPGNCAVFGSTWNFQYTRQSLKRLATRGVKTAFLFDTWSNYGRHFRLTSGQYIFPNVIFVIDEFIRNQLLALGVTSRTIVTIGHPEIADNIKTAREALLVRNQKRNNSSSEKQSGLVVTIILEPLKENYSKSDLLFDEFEFVKKVIAYTKNTDLDVNKFSIRLHPRHQQDDCQNRLRNLDNNISVVCPGDLSVAANLAESDIVFGISSIILVTAGMLGLPTYSVNPFRNEDHKVKWPEYCGVDILPGIDSLQIDSSIKKTKQIHSRTQIWERGPNRFWDTLEKCT